MNNFSGLRKGLVCVSAAPSHILVFVRAQIYAVYSLFSTVTSHFSLLSIVPLGLVNAETWRICWKLEDILAAFWIQTASNALFCW